VKRKITVINYEDDFMEFGDGWIARSDGSYVNHKLRQIRTEEGQVLPMLEKDENDIGDDTFFDVYEDEAYGC
jgi:hypothetical protein